tara:strand:+ start:519 stop:707 length:189 start_codon:yes stop_codon:yes gene_type:complete
VIDMPRMPKIKNVKFSNGTGRIVATYQERTTFGLFMGKPTKRTGRYYKNMIRTGNFYPKRKR